MKEIKVKLHTVFLLVGPSGSGKSYFSNNVLIPGLKKAQAQLPYKNLNIQYISSDETRRELLNYNYPKMAKEMLYASENAFDQLFTKLKNVTTYPVCAEAVIIDTTGLSKEFREQVTQIAKERQYNVQVIVFDYKNREEYYKHITPEDLDKHVIEKHIRRLRMETMRELDRKHTTITKIASKNFEEYSFAFDEIETYASYFLEPGLIGAVFGDVHGCLKELQKLILSFGLEIKDGKITIPPEPKVSNITQYRFISVGDLVDKGPDTKGVIDFIYNNRSWFILVKGNHDNYVYKALKKEIDRNIELEQSYFTSITEFEQDEVARNKFFYLFEYMINCAIGRDFVVTHAPCKAKYIGKVDGGSVKSMRNISYPKLREFPSIEEYKEGLEKFFGFLKDDAIGNCPAHVMGHVALTKVVTMRNKLMIDTGAVYGNQLTCVVFNEYGKKFITHIASDEPKVEKLLTLFDTTELEGLTLNDLEPTVKGRIKWMAENKVNFISGTMSPADKNEDDRVIESLDKALQYYRDKGIKQVVLQRKYMGSRTNCYVNLLDSTKSYAVSRNGYKINHVDLSKPLAELAEKVKAQGFEGVEWVILDCELMPWKVLGKGLIEDQYDVVRTGVAREINFLEQYSFEKALGDLATVYNASDFEKDIGSISKEDGYTKYGNVKFGTFGHFRTFNKQYHSLDIHSKSFDVFSTQLDLFGSDGEVRINPFSILKSIYIDGTEKLYFESINYSLFGTLNDDEQLQVNVDDFLDQERAREFYNQVTTSLKMEGVVVKPLIVYNKGIAPYLKVRNAQYLTLVYGYDYGFKHKYEKLFKRKSIRSKLSTSIREFELGKKMLEIPYKDINITNQKYVSLCIQMIVELEKEKFLDPRL